MRIIFMSEEDAIDKEIYNRFEVYFNLFLLGCCGLKIVHHFRTESFKDIRSFVRTITKKKTTKPSIRVNIVHYNFRVENGFFYSANHFYYEMVAKNGYKLLIDHTNFPYLKYWCDNIKTNSALSLYWSD